MKTLHFIGLMAVAAAAYGQIVPPTTGAQFWSTDPNLDCSGTGMQPGLNNSIPLASGGTGYVCQVSGTFVWLVAGGGYTTSIRVAAPEPAVPAGFPTAVGVDYSFLDANANDLSLDITSPNGAASSNDVNFVLTANQPAEVDLLGLPGGAPSHTSQVIGSVYAVFYCPDSFTCNGVLPQLIYSAPPTISLSVPIVGDGFQGTQWSVEGVDDGGAHRVSLAIYNIPSPTQQQNGQSGAPTIYTVQVYNSAGALVGTGTTPVIQPYGTYGDLLTNIVKTQLPSGIFKILIDGGSNYSEVIAFQANGRAVTTLQVAYDNSPPQGVSIAAPALRPSFRHAPMTSTPQPTSRPRQR